MSKEIVISGISGRFPQSRNVAEFWDNLLSGVDMVTEDDVRWTAGFAGVPERKGTLRNNLEDFDSEFFNINRKQTERLDPQIRQLLEVTFEAIMDAGCNPNSLRGANVGVYVGATSQETMEACRAYPDLVSGYDITGSSGCMFSNRISYAFDLRGPSLTMDTYCSSSLMAFHTAFMAIRNGECDAAIVAGVNLQLDPMMSLQMKKLGTLSPDGKCKAFDASADGYVRSEAIAAIFLQKSSAAFKSYATIMHTKANADGYKSNGVSFPSGAAQEELMLKTYLEAGINPSDVFYVEPHGTGTSAGDPQELQAIFSVFCKNRSLNNPLLIGSTKSNMGHAEAAASLCSLIKTVLSIQMGILPGNLHFVNANPEIPALSSGCMKVVTSSTPITGSLFGINATGIGGSNVHVILKSNLVSRNSFNSNSLPLLLPFSGRTRQGVKDGLENVLKHKSPNSAVILQKLHVENIPGLTFRGYAIAADGNAEIVCSDPVRDCIVELSKPSTLWFVFPGMGTQWARMAKELLSLETFRKSLEDSSHILNPVSGINLVDLLTTGTEEDLKRSMSVCFLAMGIALVDLLTSIDLQPDGLIGHSAGELLCGYADGSLTREEVLLIFHYKDICVRQCSGGSMAAVGLTWEEAHARCPQNVFPACHNAIDNVTLTGKTEAVADFVATLTKEGIFAREVFTGGVAYHSPYLKDVAPGFESNMKKVLKTPKLRSKKWISTSVPESNWTSELAQTASAEYILNNFLSPVYFYEALKHIPENAVVLEVSSHAMFQSILGRSLPKSCTTIGMMKRSSGDNLMRVFTAVGRLFELGFNPNIPKLYPEVQFPLMRAPCISPLIKWKHTEKHPLLDYVNKSRAGQQVTEISLTDEAYKFLEGHKIDGRILFPATGYLVLVWKEYAKTLNQPFEKLPIQFENVEFLRATILSGQNSAKLKVEFFVTGEFEIVEEATVVVTGKIQQLEVETILNSDQELSIGKFVLNREDVYKDFRLRGYEYSGLFREIKDSNPERSHSTVSWNNNWTAFLDTLVQTTILAENSRGILLPTRIRKLQIDPVTFNDLIASVVSRNVSKFPFRVAVSYCKTTKHIRCHGVEFEDLKLTRVARRDLLHPEPLIEEYKFVPYFDSEDTHWKLDTALKICVDIALENIVSRFVRVCEFVTTDVDSQIHEVVSIIESNSTRGVELVEMKELRSRGTDLLIVSKPEMLPELLNNIESSTFVILTNNETQALDLDETEWDVLALKRTFSNECLRLLAKKLKSAPQPRLIRISNTSFDWLDKVKSVLAKNESIPVYLVDDENGASGTIGLTRCLRMEYGGEQVRCTVTPKGFSFDQIQAKLKTQSRLTIIVIDESGVIGSYRHLRCEPAGSTSSDTASKYAYVNVTTTGDLSSVKWIQAPFTASYESRSDFCQVHCASLNFRDIMLAVGKLSLDALPENVTSQDCVLGLEFAGTNWRGEFVMGAVESRGLATHVVADTNFMWHVPTDWSLEEAVTVPIAYSTAYYALVVRGGIQTGESIFITSGSGGVGQAAVRIALSFSCNIFTSVGSEDKKLFLLKTFPELKESQILNSRTTEFESQILKATNGKGVNLVLNSLSEEKLQAAIRCLSNGGRFLEIGKFDLSNNSSLGMSIFLKNVSFHGILLDALFGNDNLRQKKIVVQLVSEGIQNGVVKPLPRTVFESNRAEEAFRFMASGKHIGKVVLKTRESDQITRHVVPKLYFSTKKSFVVLGGLGGFGMGLSDWLVKNGVRNLALVSRSGVTNGFQALQISRWRSIGVNALVIQMTIESQEDAHKLLDQVSKLGPVGGIFNLAMVLRDGFIENLKINDFEEVLKPKVRMTEILDIVSRVVCPELEYFVGFSSVTSGRGNEGQANYGMANSALEQICQNRRRANFPALAIQWGAIGDVGVVHEKMGGNDVNVAGTAPQSLSSCLKVMEEFLYFQNNFMNGIVSSVVPASLDKNKDHETNSHQQNQSTNLSQAILRILGMDLSTIESRSELTFGQLGMDSLMIVEMKQLLERHGETNIPNHKIRLMTWKTVLTLEKQNAEVVAGQISLT